GVTVPAGAATVSFPVTTRPLAYPDSETVVAGLDEARQAGTLDILPPAPESLSVDPAAITGGAPSAGLVTLNGEAPDGGLTIHLAGDHPSAARFPESVIVPPGFRSVDFPIQTFPVGGTVA